MTPAQRRSRTVTAPAVLLLAACSLLSACFGGGSTEDPTLLEIRIGGQAQAEAHPFAGPGPTHLDRLLRLREAAQDEHIKGVLLMVGPLGGAWARAHELAAAAAEVRKANKPVHCHVRGTDNAGYALLSVACSRISMTPGGTLDLVGVRAEVVYARELLERFGVRAELVQAGRFKGAADPFTVDEMPDTTRVTLDAILDGLRDHQLAAMEQGRSIKPERAQALIDEGPFTAVRAHRAGLVDDVGFDDEARQHLRAAAGTDSFESMEEGPEESALEMLMALLEDEAQASPDLPYLAVVTLDGTIVDAGSGAGAASAFVPHMRKLADDDHCKAVVLRIESPGGSALASDRMWHAVRRVRGKKPVVVSIGDMAASGGYYIASAATTILAPDVSLVGSIGVVGGKVEFSTLAERNGVHSERLVRGKHAGWSSPLAPLSDGERQALRGLIDDTYQRFLKRVRQGREISQAVLEPMAEGRLMLASKARAGKLVDQSGGFLEAIERARAAGALDQEAPLVTWPASLAPLQELLAPQSARARSAVEPSRLGQPALSWLDPQQRFAALRTLLSGEHLAAALPFYVRIR